MRGSAQTLARMYTTSVPEAALSAVRTQLDQLVRDHATTGHAFVQVSEIAPWGGTLRWTIRADLSSHLSCAEAPTHRRGTTTIGDQTGSTTGTTAGSSDSHTTTIGAGDSSGASTRGHTSESSTGGSHTGSTSTVTTGAMDMFEQQYAYDVDWTVTAGIDPDSLNPMNLAGGMFGAISGMPTSYSENGNTAIGSIAVMATDLTPPRSGGGGGHATSSGGASHGPEEVLPGATSPRGPRRVESSAERRAHATGSRH